MATDIKIGKVCDINPAQMTAKVTFEDRDGVTSDWLPINCFGRGGNYHYWMPDIGEQVTALTVSDGDGEGIILGSRYSEASPPKENSQNKRKIEFKNGDFIEYDRGSGNLTIKVSGVVKINGSHISLND